MSVAYADQEPIGLAELLGTLIEQNLARDPARHRLLKPATVVVGAPDAGVVVTLRFGRGEVTIANGADPHAAVAVRAEAHDLFALAGAPLRLGLPDPFRTQGRAVLGRILRGRIHVRGLISRLPTVRRLTMLLSAN